MTSLLSSSCLHSRLQKTLKLPDGFVLAMDLEGTDLVEKADANPLSQVGLLADSPTLLAMTLYETLLCVYSAEIRQEAT